MKLSEFDYHLPDELIAQEPLPNRDECRLLVLNRADRSLEEGIFRNIIEFIKEGDLLILNDTRVLPARLTAKKKTGGRLEILLLKEKGLGIWEVLVKPGRRAHLGESIAFAEGRFYAEILDKTPAGGRLIRFTPPKQNPSKTKNAKVYSPQDIRGLINRYGRMPIPHYINRDLKVPDYYQTVFAKTEGAVAAPTAGLHFTKELLDELNSSGVKVVYITLHCGLSTFRPVKTPDIREHKMEGEFFRIDSKAARAINQAKAQKKRIFAVGTTVARALEAAGFMNQDGVYQVSAQQGETKFYIYPGYKFKIIDGLLTNFHLPRSTNLILVSAFAGIESTHLAYEYAIKKRFRFYSFGDAMLIK